MMFIIGGHKSRHSYVNLFSTIHLKYCYFTDFLMFRMNSCLPVARAMPLQQAKIPNCASVVVVTVALIFGTCIIIKL